MVIFHSYVSLPEGKPLPAPPKYPDIPTATNAHEAGASEKAPAKVLPRISWFTKTRWCPQVIDQGKISAIQQKKAIFRGLTSETIFMKILARYFLIIINTKIVCLHFNPLLLFISVTTHWKL